MFYNFAQLKTELLNRLKTNNNAVSASRRGDWLNEAQDNIATEFDPDHLIAEETITTEAGVREYATKFEFNKIISVIDLDQDLNLSQISEGHNEFMDPARDDAGSPLFYTIGRLSWVIRQPLNPVRVKIVSNSTSDSTQKVRINGIVNGVEDTELLQLDGTTEVTGDKFFTHIHGASKDNPTTGKVTVSILDYDSSADVFDTFIMDTSELLDITERVIAEFGPKQLAVQKQGISIWPVVDDVRDIRVRGYVRPRMMVNDEDFPDFPESYHQLILIDATIRGHNDLFRPNLAEQVREKEWKPLVAKLKAQMGNTRGKMSPVLRGQVGMTIHRGGRLPGNYPEW